MKMAIIKKSPIHFVVFILVSWVNSNGNQGFTSFMPFTLAFTSTPKIQIPSSPLRTYHINSLIRAKNEKSQEKELTYPFCSRSSTSSQLHIVPSTAIASSTALATITKTSTSALFATISSPIISIFVLSFVVFIHEAGHFLAARSMNINVQEFSVGVGPKIAGYTTKPEHTDSEDKKRNQSNIEKKRFNFFNKRGSETNIDSGEEINPLPIEFSLRLIPLGGYVRFPDNYDREEAAKRQMREMQDRTREREVKRQKKEQSSDDKMKNFPLLSKMNLSPGKSTTKNKQNKKSGRWWEFNNLQKETNEKGTITLTNKKKDERLAIDYFKDPNLLQNRPWTQRAIVLVGGIVFNLLLAFSIYFGQVTVGRGLPTPLFEPGAVVRVVSSTPSNDAAYGKLYPGDLIVGYNGHQMGLSKTSGIASSQDEISKLITTIRSTKPGDSISLSVLPYSKSRNTISLQQQQKQARIVSIQPQVSINPATGEYLTPPSLGITLAPNYIQTKMIHADSVANAFQLASNSLVDITTVTATSTTNAIYNLLFSKSSSNNELRGPIGVIQMGSEIASSSSYDVGAIAAFAAAISVNLAVVNALPLPALDGGQLVFVLLEGVAGRKVVDQRLEEEINAFALFLILLFSLSTAVGDISSIVVER